MAIYITALLTLQEDAAEADEWQGQVKKFGIFKGFSQALFNMIFDPQSENGRTREELLKPSEPNSRKAEPSIQEILVISKQNFMSRIIGCSNFLSARK